MNTRTKLWTAAAGIVVAFTLSSRLGFAAPDRANVPIPGAIAITMDKPIDIGVSSKPFKIRTAELRILGVSRAQFHLGPDFNLTAKMKAGVMQHARMEYLISAAIFDARGQMLGAAEHTEKVERIRLSRTPMMLREFTLDFGISKAYANAAYVVVSISDRDVPNEPN
jgi:hypothetical protein